MMPKVFSSTDLQSRLRDALFRPMGADGVYARTQAYEDVIERLACLITRQRDAAAEVFRFPPVMSRADIEKQGYLKSFPNLLGCACALHGSEADIRAVADSAERGGAWTASLAPTELVLSPAACYPVYPIAAARGPVPAEGYLFDVACECFRREPSPDLDRLQSFRMREYVRIGTPDQITTFREDWLDRAQKLADDLRLQFRVEQASDPFFGRIGQMKAIAQLQQSLKFELLVPLHSQTRPTACMSFNYHRDHFGTTWDLADAASDVSHTGCVAFGMDRLALALFWTHGLDPRDWPASTRKALAF